MELERKWLVERIPPEVEAVTGDSIAQGYLAIEADGAEVRVRRRATRCSLTVKRGRGLAREEREVEISADQFEVLWPATEGRRIEKTRRVIDTGDLPEGTAIEVDEYSGALSGLRVAEVEFPDESSARAFQAPAWFGREVTEEDAYKNRHLATDGWPSSHL